MPEIVDPRTRLPRGALSIAVARALEGEAATDGVITTRSLASFVRRHVRLVAQGVQNTDIIWPTVVTDGGVHRDTQLFVLPGKPPPVAPGVRPVRLGIHGRSAADAQRIINTLRNAALAGSGEAETLAWHAERRLVLNDQGHRIAENVGERDLQGVVDCRLALDRLIQMAANGLDVQVLIDGQDTPASDATRKPGDKLAVKVSGLENGNYLAVFNFAGNGLVEMLEPTPYHASDPQRADFKRPHFTTGTPVYSSERSLPDVQVGEPFGADHVIAVAGARPLSRLMAALVASHRQPEIPAVMAALASERAGPAAEDRAARHLHLAVVGGSRTGADGPLPFACPHRFPIFCGRHEPSQPLSPGGCPLVPPDLRRPHAGAGGGVAGDPGRQPRADRGADGQRQDAGGVPCGHRFAGAPGA